MLPSDQLSTRSTARPGYAPPMSSRCADAPEKPTSSPSKKIGIDDRDVRRVRRAEVRVVVEDDVAVVDVVAEDRDHALDDLRHRAHEHRRRVRLGELVALAVEDAGAEILGLADDRRVATCGRARRPSPWRSPRRRRRSRASGSASPGLRRRLGASARRAVDDDVAGAVDLGDEAGRDHGRRVVLLDDRRPLDAVAGPQQRPIVERRQAALRLAVDVEDDLALDASSRGDGSPSPASSSAALELGDAARCRPRGR